MAVLNHVESKDIHFNFILETLLNLLLDLGLKSDIIFEQAR